MAVMPYCTACGSADVVRSAQARWDMSRQQFVLDGIGKSTHCAECGAENSCANAELDGTTESLAANLPHVFKCIDWRKMPQCKS